MKRIFFVSVIIGSIFVAQVAGAQTHTPRINKHQVKQEKRIKQGVRNGELTRHETRYLQKREAKIQRDKRMAKAKGYVTPMERRHIRREQKRTSHAIYRAKHNERVRG